MDFVVEWSRDVFIPLGVPGLFVISFVEASFFPVPPDVILIPLVLHDPGGGLLYGFVATLGSVLGALFGYLIGLKGGRPLAVKIVGEDRICRAEDYFNKYGVWMVGLAAFTPIPYKVFTITSGALKLKNLRGFVVASVIGRGGRFIAEAVIIMLYGEAIINFMKTYFEYLTLAVAGIVVIFLAIRYRKHLWMRG